MSHVLGVGGRDLSETIAGRSAPARRPPRMLDADPGQTDHIVLISKPPAPSATAAFDRVVRSLTTPVTTVLLGRGGGRTSPIGRGTGPGCVSGCRGTGRPTWGAGLGERRRIDGSGPRGLFSGGTLADEAMVIAEATLGGIRSNIPLRPDLALAASHHGRPDLTGLGVTFVDFGDDAYRRSGAPDDRPDAADGTPADQAADPAAAVVLLDVVLGHGAEPDPAELWRPGHREGHRLSTRSRPAPVRGGRALRN